MKTNIISFILFGLIMTGLVTGGVQYLSTPEDKVDNTVVQTDTENFQDVANAPEASGEIITSTINATLTEEEVIAIANSLPEVQDFIARYGAESYAYYDGYGLWQVEYYPNTTTANSSELDSTTYLIVLIEDATGEVIDLYYGNEWGYMEPGLIENATNFLFSTDLMTGIDQDSFVIYGDGFGDEIYLSGYSEVDYHWFSASLTVTGDSFQVNSVTADFRFGETVHSFDEVLQIVLETPEGENFTSTTNYTSTIVENAYYDAGMFIITFSVSLYEDYWSVDPSSPDEEIPGGAPSEPVPPENQTDPEVPTDPVYPGGDFFWTEGYLYAEIDDQTGDIIYLYYEQPYTPLSTETEVLEVVFALEEIQQWISSVGDYEYYISFWAGEWYVSFNDLNYTAWAYVSVEDGTLQVLYYETFLPTPATRTESEIIEIANQSGLADYLDEHKGYGLQVVVSYDNYGTWEVYAYSEVYVELFYYVVIDDVSGDVLYTDTLDFEIAPVSNISSIIDIVQANENYTSFMQEYPNATIHVFYMGGQWYVDVYVESTDAVYFSSSEVLSFTIDDRTGEIIEIFRYTWGYLDEPVDGNY